MKISQIYPNLINLFVFRHIMLNPETSEEYDTSKYDTLIDIGTPILSKEGFVFAINGSHASLIDVNKEKSVILKLPQDDLFPNGMFR